MARPVSVDPVEHIEDMHELVTGEAVALDLRPQSFILRAAGAMIDYLVYFGAYILIMVMLFTFASQLGLDDALLRTIGVIGLVLCIVVIPVTVELLSQGKSLGKLAVGARIVRDDGGAIGFRHAFIRALLGVFEIYISLGGVAAITGLLNGKAKRMGDLLAGTYSQNERVSKIELPVFGVPVPLIEWSRTADVARMPDALARRTAQFLRQAPGLTPVSRERLSRELAHEVSVYVSPVPIVGAELFLAAVAAVRRDREFAALELEKAGLARLAPALEGTPRGFPDRG
ncbi:MAG: RDD family protein [Salinibacterium sp.]|nr:RDD family protein [Salinibacterium sp.]